MFLTSRHSGKALRGAEGASAAAGGKALMHGFNRLGLVWCSSSKALCQQVIEKEWGFVGQQETDAVARSVRGLQRPLQLRAGSGDRQLLR